MEMAAGNSRNEIAPHQILSILAKKQYIFSIVGKFVKTAIEVEGKWRAAQSAFIAHSYKKELVSPQRTAISHLIK